MGWDDILKRLVDLNIASAEQKTAKDLVTDKSIPSPIRFEYLADHSVNRSGGINIFGKLKDDIAYIATASGHGINLPPTGIQELLLNADINNLLTTNYDLTLERCFGVDIRSITESKYILSPTTPKGVAPSIYHVHGIADKSSTICIGYEHYMGYIQKLRSRLIRDRRKRETVEQVIFLLLRLVPPSLTWEELFFTTNMSIVGLGLAFEETDLWELLVLRAAVLNTSDILSSFGLAKEVFTNIITYYAIEVPDEQTKDGDKTTDYVAQAKRIRRLRSPVIDDEYWLPVPDNKAKEKALKGLNVEIRVVHTANYEAGYEKVLGLLPVRP